MRIIFDKYVNNQMFSKIYLRDIILYASQGNSDMLVLDFQNTSFISPSVLCDLLSVFSYIKETYNTVIYLLFGWNTKLVEFLGNTDFFLAADVGRSVYTDVLELSPITQKRENTDKIRRIKLPTYFEPGYRGSEEVIYHFKDETIEEAESRIRQMVSKDFWSLNRKVESIARLGINNDMYIELSKAFSELIINAYSHAGGNYCYYTFQNYNRSGLSFVCSDNGSGCYYSFREKIDLKWRKEGLFSDRVFFEYENDRYIRSLMGIVESILYRYYNNKQIFDRGIIDIIKTILAVGKDHNPVFRIQSDYAMLQIDARSVKKLFDGIDEINPLYFDYSSITPKIDVFEKLVLDQSIRQDWITSKHVVFSPYYFPGVHISISIDPIREEKEGSDW
ncbi:hypothetical protein [Aristaeella hokkaidonensis]|uniref:Uncharacterized protein n=1 Tax=Aristaeella hokkaidonensis TaxID=3046382 RepID=A0AC61MXH2_9FIRM|nr:hypothetical protein [Aristaeella hokkaidonensis]QUC66358.1 hypothetical protein JYE49_10870 [Aristaeella hokkaidonensis]SNT94231.1 hypothetical protein SAMN06297421_104204 [Aristaeella hokkaidonensis]